MVDKLEKVKAEIKRRLLPTIRDRRYDEWEEGGNNALINILSFIDSLEEEPKPKFRKGEKVIYLNEEYVVEDITDHYILRSTRERTSVPVVHVDFGNEDYELRLVEEPVSEELEEAIDTYLATYFGGEKEKQDWPFLKKMAIHFAKWQRQKDEHLIWQTSSANWQKERMIDKACGLLKSYRRETKDGMGYISGIIDDKMIEDFKKLMGI